MLRRSLHGGLALLFLATVLAAQDEAAQRARLVEIIEDDVAATRRQLGRAELDARVLKAIGAVPRHEFVPDDQRPYAYQNRPLAIGHGQTISQPYIVAIMTDLIEPKAEHRVLEIGTGSAYQAAVLAELVDRVYSVEIVPPLGEQARRRLDRLGYDNVVTRIGDGYEGWEEHAPFDAIIVTAAAGHVPPPLIRQLKPGGKLIIPVGRPFATQQLTLLSKSDDGEVTSRQILPVAFVPLTGRR